MGCLLAAPPRLQHAQPRPALLVPAPRLASGAAQEHRRARPAREIGFGRVEITTDKGNAGSSRVIEANGGRFVEEFVEPRYGGEPRRRLVIDLAART